MLGENSIQSFLYGLDILRQVVNTHMHTHSYRLLTVGWDIISPASLSVSGFFLRWCWMTNHKPFKCFKVNVWLKKKSFKQSWVLFSWVISKCFFMLCDGYLWRQLCSFGVCVPVSSWWWLTSEQLKEGLMWPRLDCDQEVRGRKCSHTLAENTGRAPFKERTPLML